MRIATVVPTSETSDGLSDSHADVVASEQNQFRKMKNVGSNSHIVSKIIQLAEAV